MQKPKSWAQIVAGPKQATFDVHLEIAKRERLERLKNERAKTEVTISTRNASDDVQKNIEVLKEKDLTKLLEDHIHGCLKAEEKPIINIKRGWKVAKHVIKIQCNSSKEAALIKELDWEKLLEGVHTMSPMYGVVVHGAPKYVINVRNGNIEEVKEKIQLVNNIKVKHVRPLMRNPRNPQALTESIIIFTEDAEEANSCINNGLRLGGRIFLAERYAPLYQIKQYFQCQMYGHRMENCTRKVHCGRCAGDHETRECSSDSKKEMCVQYQGPHVAWHHSCPRRQKEAERLEILRATLPSHFLC